LVAIGLAAVAVGAAMSLLKGTGGGARLQLGNLSAPWLLIAFLAGSRYRRVGTAAAAGVFATFAALVGFYGEQSPLVDLSAASIRFIENPGQVVAFVGTAHEIVYLGGLVTGLLFGSLGWVWRTCRSRWALGAVAVMFVAEPVALVGTGAMIGGSHAVSSYWWIWLGEIALGIALLAASIRPRRVKDHRT
jgi:hypothetical protein